MKAKPAPHVVVVTSSQAAPEVCNVLQSSGYTPLRHDTLTKLAAALDRSEGPRLAVLGVADGLYNQAAASLSEQARVIAFHGDATSQGTTHETLLTAVQEAV